MSQTGFIAFTLLAIFAVYLSAKGELGTYISFFFITGNDATAQNSSGASSSVTGEVASQVATAALAAGGF